jgi:hypothetical protein
MVLPKTVARVLTHVFPAIRTRASATEDVGQDPRYVRLASFQKRTPCLL